MPYNYPIYQNNYPNLSQPSLLPTQMSGTLDERIWVTGAASAEAYLVAPNSFVRLWDSAEPVFYEKRADASGRPYPIEVYEYKRREAQKPLLPSESTVNYIEEIKSLEERISALESNAKKEGKRNATKSNANDTGIPEV